MQLRWSEEAAADLVTSKYSTEHNSSEMKMVGGLHSSSCSTGSSQRSTIVVWKPISNHMRNVVRSRCEGQTEGTRYQPLSCSSKISLLISRRNSRACASLSHSGSK